MPQFERVVAKFFNTKQERRKKKMGEPTEIGEGVLWENAWKAYSTTKPLSRLNRLSGASWFRRNAETDKNNKGMHSDLLSLVEWKAAWRHLHDEGLDNPVAWALSGTAPSVAREWLLRCQANSWEQWVALEWLLSGRQLVPAMLDAGICPQEYRVIAPYCQGASWLAKLSRGPDVTLLTFALVQAWLQHDITADVAHVWRQLGFFHPEHAAAWRNYGFSPVEASELELVGLTPDAAIAVRPPEEFSTARVADGGDWDDDEDFWLFDEESGEFDLY
jgi:hypothetical protein